MAFFIILLAISQIVSFYLIFNKIKPIVKPKNEGIILKVIPDATLNLIHINPGACGKHGWHKISTLVRFTIDRDRLKNLEVIELGKKG
jgi:hypothetical protein